MAPTSRPDLPFTLPSNCFTVNPPTDIQDSSASLRSLRVSIEIKLLLPSSLVGDKPKKRGLQEEDLEVVVPVGGRVVVQLKTVAKALTHLNPSVNEEADEKMDEEPEEHAQCRAQFEEDVQQMAASRLRRLLMSNKKKLAIRRVCQDKQSSLDFDDPAITMFTLFPVTAEATASPLANDIVPSGSPVAYLQRVNISAQWYISKKTKTKQDRENSQPDPCIANRPILDANDDILLDDDEEQDEDELIFDGDNLLMEEEDDMLVDDDQPLGSEPIAPSQNASQRSCKAHQPAQQAITPSVFDATLCDNDIPKDNEHNNSLVPGWAIEQIRAGLSKVLRLHMIRRFPLIFDGSLLSYIPSFVLPNSLASSLSRFLKTSENHRTLFAPKALTALKSVLDEQEGEIMGKVRNLLTLTKSKKKPVQPIQDDSQNGKKRKLKTSGHKVEECEDPIEDYLVTMRETMREQTFSIRRSYEMRIRWVLRDAMARIGRSEWSSRRTGSGKLCAARIQLQDDDVSDDDGEDRNSLATSLQPLQAGIVPTAQRGLVQEHTLEGLDSCDDGDLLQDDYDDDDVLQDEEDEYQLEDGIDLDAARGVFPLRFSLPNSDPRDFGHLESSLEASGPLIADSMGRRIVPASASSPTSFRSQNPTNRYRVSVANKDDDLDDDLLQTDEEDDSLSCVSPYRMTTSPLSQDLRIEYSNYLQKPPIEEDELLLDYDDNEVLPHVTQNHPSKVHVDDDILDDDDGAHDILQSYEFNDFGSLSLEYPLSSMESLSNSLASASSALSKGSSDQANPQGDE